MAILTALVATVALLVLSVVAPVHANLVVQSFSDTEQIINGKSHKVHTVTVTADQNDVGEIGPLYSITDPATQKTYGVRFTFPQPAYVYSMGKVGWIPSYVEKIDNQICLVDQPMTEDARLKQPTNVPTDNYVSRFVGHDIHRTNRMQTDMERKSIGIWSTRNTVSDNSRDLVAIGRPPGLRDNRRSGLLSFSAQGSVAEGKLCNLLSKIPFIGGGDCDDGNAAAIKALSGRVDVLFQDFNVTTQMLAGIQKFDDQTQSTLIAINQRDDIYYKQIVGLQNAVSDNFKSTQQLWHVTSALANRMDDAFQQVHAQVLAIVTNERGLHEQLRNLTLTIITQTQQQVIMIDQNLVQTKGLEVEIYKIMRKVQVRRAVIKQLWQRITDLTAVDTASGAGTTCAFVQCSGMPPMASATLPAFASMRTCGAPLATCKTRVSTDTMEKQTALSQFATISDVRLMYTRNESGTLTAVERIITYKCSKKHVLNNFLPQTDFAGMFRSLGPDRIYTANSNETCYGNSSDMTAPTSCKCVIQQTWVSCVLKANAPIFPFGWGNNESLTTPSWRTDAYCTNGRSDVAVPVVIIKKDNIAVATQISQQGSIFTNSPRWDEFLRELCVQSSGFVFYNNVARVRVRPQNMGAWHDLPLSTNANITDLCSSNFADLINIDNYEKRMSTWIYTFWVNDYNTNATRQYSNWEQELYGSVPTGITTDEQFWNMRPDVQQMADCVTMRIAKIAGSAPAISGARTRPETKLPLWSIAPVRVAFEQFLPSVTITDPVTGAVLVMRDGVPQGVTVNGANATVGAAIKESDVFQYVLPRQVFFAGEFWATDNWLSKRMIHDIPFDIMPAARSRDSYCGSPMYITQPLTELETTEIGAVRWTTIYGQPFRPECATESPHNYLRLLTTDGNMRCQPNGVLNVATGTAIPDYDPGFNDLCTLAEFFKMVPVTANGITYLHFQPRQFTIQMTVEIPMGIFTQQLVSSCPSNYTITYDANGANGARFTTSSVAVISVRATLTSYDRNLRPVAVCGITLPKQYSFSAASPLVIPQSDIPACGPFQYLQITTLDSDVPCYPAPGLEMGRTYTSNSAPAAPIPTRIWTSTFVDESVLALAKSTNALTRLQYQYNNLANDFTKNLNQIKDAGAAYLAAALASVANSTYNQQRNSAFVDAEQAQIANYTADAVASLAAEWERNKLIANLSALINGDLTALNLTNFQNQILERAVEQAFADTVQYWKDHPVNVQDNSDAKCDDCFLYCIPLLGDILGPMLCPIFKGVATVFHYIIIFIVIVVVIALIGFAWKYCGLGLCCKMCCKKCQHGCEDLATPKHKKYALRQKHKAELDASRKEAEERDNAEDIELKTLHDAHEQTTVPAAAAGSASGAKTAGRGRNRDREMMRLRREYPLMNRQQSSVLGIKHDSSDDDESHMFSQPD